MTENTENTVASTENTPEIKVKLVAAAPPVAPGYDDCEVALPNGAKYTITAEAQEAQWEASVVRDALLGVVVAGVRLFIDEAPTGWTVQAEIEVEPSAPLTPPTPKRRSSRNGRSDARQETLDAANAREGRITAAELARDRETSSGAAFALLERMRDAGTFTKHGSTYVLLAD